MDSWLVLSGEDLNQKTIKLIINQPKNKKREKENNENEEKLNYIKINKKIF